MSTIYVRKEGQEWGPFTTEELEGKVGEGVFSLEDLFWTEGMEDWQPLGSVGVVAQEGTGESASVFEVEETDILFDSPEARLTAQTLHLMGEDLPVASVAKASVQFEEINRTRPIIGCIIVGVVILCIALAEIPRPHLTAWVIWGVILLGLCVWWLRMMAVAIRSGATMLIVDLRNGDERLVRMDPDDARELATAIDQAVIAALDR